MISAYLIEFDGAIKNLPFLATQICICLTPSPPVTYISPWATQTGSRWQEHSLSASPSLRKADRTWDALLFNLGLPDVTCSMSSISAILSSTQKSSCQTFAEKKTQLIVQVKQVECWFTLWIGTFEWLLSNHVQSLHQSVFQMFFV